MADFSTPAGDVIAASLAPTDTISVFQSGLRRQTALSQVAALVGGGSSNPTFANVALTGLLTESSASGIVAFAGGGQASATQLTLEINRVITVASAFDSVKLPASSPGLSVVVINVGASTLQVFGSVSDVINGALVTTGISQPANSVETYWCGATGFWYADLGAGFAGQLFTELAATGVTAFAGGGKASATPIVAQMSRVNTVATASDSVVLPLGVPGLELMILNKGANSMQVFGAGTDTIDDVATGTGIAQMANSLVIYMCANTGQWYTEGSATGFGGPGLQTQSYTNASTAFAGGGQASATQMVSMVNRVTTVATIGDSIKLPAAVSGLVVTVINATANACQVFGASADTINGIAAATGVAQMGRSSTTYTCIATGLWETDGVGQGYSGNFPTVSWTNAITAFATGGQASAVPLTTQLNRITVVATGADSVKLPSAIAGMQITVYNSAATNSANVFPNTGDNINALAANTAFALAAGKNSTFGCAVNGTWHAILSA